MSRSEGSGARERRESVKNWSDINGGCRRKWKGFRGGKNDGREENKKEERNRQREGGMKAVSAERGKIMEKMR